MHRKEWSAQERPAAVADVDGGVDRQSGRTAIRHWAVLLLDLSQSISHLRSPRLVASSVLPPHSFPSRPAAFRVVSVVRSVLAPCPRPSCPSTKKIITRPHLPTVTLVARGFLPTAKIGRMLSCRTNRSAMMYLRTRSSQVPAMVRITVSCPTPHLAERPDSWTHRDVYHTDWQ